MPAAATPSPASDAAAVVAHLETLASADNRTGMARFGIATDTAFGIPNAVLRPLARTIGRDQARALALWQSGWREARLVGCFSAEPKKFTAAQARDWAQDFASWEVVDHAADLFVEAGLAGELVPDFAEDGREFVRRAGFAMIAWAAVHLKKEPDARFSAWLALIERHAHDERNFVKKAVSWALRQTGKRSLRLYDPALALAQRLAEANDRARRWVGKDALRELSAPKTLERLRQKAQRPAR
ncbi:MAG: DNA alkylation repair protein [Nitratireductor sp.]